MENVSDRTFRSICKSFGADLVYTEFANCEAIIRDVQRTLNKISVLEGERPIGVQIYGSTESSMERAAATAELSAPDFIDINCGCWVKKIAMRGDGAGLLRDLKKFENVVQSVMKGHAPACHGQDAPRLGRLEPSTSSKSPGCSSRTASAR